MILNETYQCQRCTACCRWPGQVRLTNPEIAALAAFKGCTEFEFIQRFTRLKHDRRGLALEEQPNGACIFLEGRDCTVQPVKPEQCRDFPNRWNNPEFEKLCRAVPMANAGAQLQTVRAGAPSRAGGEL